VLSSRLFGAYLLMYGKRPGVRKFGRILREEEGEGKKWDIF